MSWPQGPWTDERRCVWCRRLCRYFGQDKWGWCILCQQWYMRNQYFKTYECVCKAPGTKIWPLHFVWVVSLLRDSDQVYANFVQQRLWREFLLGPLPFDVNSGSSSDSDSDIHVYSGMFPIGQFPYGKASVWRWLLTFWGIDMRGVPGNSTWKLCPMWRHRACTSQPNILYVIIKFLGPFTPFDHTHFW